MCLILFNVPITLKHLFDILSVCVCTCVCEDVGLRVCVRVYLHVYVCLCVCLYEGLCDIAFYIGCI